MIKEDQNELEEHFLTELFHCCINDRTICEIVLQNVKLNYLPEQEQKDLLTEIKNYISSHKKLPTYGALRLIFRKDHGVLDLISSIQDIEEKPDPETILSSLQDFLKESIFSEDITEMARLYNLGDRRKAFDKYTSSAEKFSKFSLSSVYAETVFKDYDARQVNRIVDSASDTKTKIPTGIFELDQRTHGGPELGELIMWMARSKGGKSFALTHLGVHAARMGYGVAHFQLEGTKRQCFNRYDSLWTGSTYYDTKDGNISEEKAEKIRKIVRVLGKSDIHVIAPERFGAMTMLEIRKKIIELKKRFDIKLVIIDYMDLVESGEQKYGPSEQRQKLEKVNRMMKDLAIEQNIVIHTATQASDVEFEKFSDPNFVLRREHLKDFKGKVEAVDGLISINRTPDEIKAKTCRLFMEAFREHSSEEVIFIKQNLRLSKFYDHKNTLKEFIDLEQ